MTKNIMIVDDSFIDRKMIRRILEKHIDGISVTELDTGSRLIELLRQSDIRVLILNMRMPDSHGLELLAKIKATEETRDIPVIITGTNEIENIEQALSLGALDYITKPLTEEVMKIALPLKVTNAIALMHRTQQIHFLSYHDELTGLYNRRYFEEELRRLDTRRQRPLSLILGDLNGLKSLNDLYGHHEGDRALKAMGDVLRSTCRQEDIIARWGGDEFIILLPQTDQTTTEEIMSRIQSSCERVDYLKLPLSISLGAATKTSDSQSVDQMVLTADQRMYQDKFALNRGRHQDLLHRLKVSLEQEDFQSRFAEALQLDGSDYHHLLKLIKSMMHA